MTDRELLEAAAKAAGLETFWHGWSGYGVGAGLEDAGYGYSTDEREERLWELFEHPVAA